MKLHAELLTGKDKKMAELKINEFVKEVHQNAVEHGWWDGEERKFGELIALCHAELSEALEEFRNGHEPTDTYYSIKDIYGKEWNTSQKSDDGKAYKPEGIPSELADVIIRIFDMCGRYDIDIEAILKEKHEFNKTRPYKHGGKVI